MLAELDDVTVVGLSGTARVSDVLALLDRAEATAGVPLVDESERVRLEDLAAPGGERPASWRSALATRDDRPVGYAGLVLDGPGPATGDVAVDRADAAAAAVLQALLAVCRRLGRDHAVDRLQVWLRDVRDPELSLAEAAGYRVDRRLGILARPLDEVPAVVVPEGVTIDTFTEADADAVVEVLAAAYAGTDDGGWTRAALDVRRELDWFDPADLLVARDRDDGRVLGIHWTKQRGGGVGEVHNLALHPRAQGRGLGGALLAAGLAHLREIGCHEVMLWVDLANERAVQLYRAQGFEVAWVDVALGHELAPR